LNEEAPLADQEAFAREVDARDPLAPCRESFHLPRHEDGHPVIYLCGNSLGLQPKAARELLERELDDWARLAVGAHFHGRTPWYSYHEVVRDSGARLVGARPGEVVMMNSLTVNLHLMMVSFYRPTPERHRILVEGPTFPSDLYAVHSQLRHHGYDPREDLVVARPREGEEWIRTEDLEALLEERGREIAVVLLSGVNYFSGQLFDMARITRAAKAHGCAVGLDLAHAAGNAVLHLHDWDVDFAVWCSYKYLNAGPGAVAGCFVHERHGSNASLGRFAGWWGNDPATRFEMQTRDRFVPFPGADGWQLSNPPILAMAPLKASLEIFDAVGMEALREKSLMLTAFLQNLLDRIPGDRFEIITPREPAARGCQLSIRVAHGTRELFEALEAEGVVGDLREPDVIRVAPVPLYNTFHEVWRFVSILSRLVGTERAGHAGKP
jgi:kynureninase